MLLNYHRTFFSDSFLFDIFASVPSFGPSVLSASSISPRPTPKSFSRPINTIFSRPSSRPYSRSSPEPSTKPFHLLSSEPSSKLSYKPISKPSPRPSSRPNPNPSTKPSHKLSPKLSSKISFRPSSRLSQEPLTKPSHIPSSKPSSRLSSRPSQDPLTKQSHIPSSKPSSWPSFRPSQDPLAKPSQMPSYNPLSEPTPVLTLEPRYNPSTSPMHLCVDDESYKSYYGLSCSDHSALLCSKMHEVGFTAREVIELIMRCKKSCDSCWITTKPSYEPSSKISLKPSIKPSMRPLQKPSSSPLPGPWCKDDQTYKSRYGFSCHKHSFSECNRMAEAGFTVKEVKILINRCKISCGLCSISDNIPHLKKQDLLSQVMDKPSPIMSPSQNLSKASQLPSPTLSYPPSVFPSKISTHIPSAQPSHWTNNPSSFISQVCEDDATYISRYGFLCDRHSSILCNKMTDIGYTLQDVKELKLRCKKSCRICQSNTKPSNSFNVGNPSLGSYKRQIFKPVQKVSSSPTFGLSYSPTSSPSKNCQDDFTYRSHYGFPCNIYVTTTCTRMGEVGFTAKQTKELIMRCKKSCNVCWPNSKQSNVATLEVPTSHTSNKPGLPSSFPCEDDVTYRSRYGFPCLMYSATTCSRMVEVGFTLEQVNDLIIRCRKSCGSCMLPTKPPSSLLSKEIVLSSNFPSKVPSNAPSIIPSISFFLASSDRPSSQPILIPSDQPVTRGIILSSSFHSKLSNKTPTIVPSISISLALNSVLPTPRPSRKPSIELFKPSFPPINSFINSIETVKNKEDFPCKDDIFFKDRNGLSCHQYSGILCEKLGTFGLHEDEIKESIEKCKFSCKQCNITHSFQSETPVVTHFPVTSPIEINSDKTNNDILVKTNARSNHINDNEITTAIGDPKSSIVKVITSFAIIAGVLVILMVLGLIVKRNIKNKELDDGLTSFPHFKEGGVPFWINNDCVEYETMSSPDDLNHSFVELAYSASKEVDIVSGSRVPNVDGAFDLARITPTFKNNTSHSFHSLDNGPISFP